MEKATEVMNPDETKKCFFITPIGEIGSEEYQKLIGIEENILKPLLADFGYELNIAHKIQNIGSIGDQIFESILNSDLIIANLSGLNPNVMYETAVAHSFGKPTIMICENDTELPFDMKIDRTIFFENTIIGSGNLKREIIEKINAIRENDKIDNPVFRVIRSVSNIESLKNINETTDNKLIDVVLDLKDTIESLKKEQSYILENKVNNLSSEKNTFKTNLNKKTRYKMCGIKNDYTISVSEYVPKEKKEQYIDAIEHLTNAKDKLPSYEELSEFIHVPINRLKRDILFLND